MLLQLESVVFFVHDIDAAAAWYAALLGVLVEHETRAMPSCARRTA